MVHLGTTKNTNNIHNTAQKSMTAFNTEMHLMLEYWHGINRQSHAIPLTNQVWLHCIIDAAVCSQIARSVRRTDKNHIVTSQGDITDNGYLQSTKWQVALRTFLTTTQSKIDASEDYDSVLNARLNRTGAHRASAINWEEPGPSGQKTMTGLE